MSDFSTTPAGAGTSGSNPTDPSEVEGQDQRVNPNEDTRAEDSGGGAPETATTEFRPYRERDDFVPNPLDQNGVVDTSETGGRRGVKDVTNAYKVAEAVDSINAARALDPEDPGVHRSMVNLSGDGARDPEEAKEAIKANAERFGYEPSMSPARAETPADRAKAEARLREVAIGSANAAPEAPGV